MVARVARVIGRERVRRGRHVIDRRPAHDSSMHVMIVFVSRGLGLLWVLCLFLFFFAWLWNVGGVGGVIISCVVSSDSIF